MSALRLAAALLLTAAAAQALDVVPGAFPKIDGVVGKDEWEGAAKLEAGEGVAYLRTTGRVLCIGIRVARPYAGERIDLHVADRDGRNYTWHAFHPASATPKLSGYPLAPVMVRRSSWDKRSEAPVDPPRRCLFRSRVYADEKSWSTEIAIDVAALDVSVVAPLVFRLDVLIPAGPQDQVLEFAPGGTQPDQWMPLQAVWPDEGRRLETKDEDARRAFELHLFKEIIALASSRPAPGQPPPPVEDPVEGPAFNGKKNNEKIAAVLARVDDCLAADPADFFAGLFRVRFLRRANRPEEAYAALQAVEKRFPYADVAKVLPLAEERFNALVGLGRISEAVELPLPNEAKQRWKEIELQWTLEQIRWEARKNLPRVAFQTSKGRIVAEIYPGCADHVLALVRDGAFNDKVFDDVVGGFGARIAEEKKPRRAPAPDRPRFAWRGTIALPITRDGKRIGSRLLFATGLAMGGFAGVGRVVEGQDHADALEAGDRIESAQVLAEK